METKITKENKERIVDLLAQYNMTEIAKMFGVSRERIRQIVRIKLPKYKANPKSSKFREAERLISEDPDVLTTSDAEIARRYGVSKGKVASVRYAHGIRKYRKSKDWWDEV